MRRLLSLQLIVVTLFALVACTAAPESSDDSTPTSNTVTGVVKAPASQVAALQQRTLLQALLGLLSPDTQASTIGTGVVPNATVELITVDDNGNQNGGVYVSVTTDNNGRYAFTLPSSLSMMPKLMVRVSGSSEILRAPVVQSVVDVTPESEWLVRRLVELKDSGGPTLSIMGRGLVLFLQGVVDSMAVNAGGDLASTYANLDAFRSVFDGQYSAFTAGVDQSGIPGTYHIRGNTLYSGWFAEPAWGSTPFVGSMLNTLSHYTVTLTYIDGNKYNATLSGDESETSLFVHGSNCNTQATQPYVSCTTMAASGFNGNAGENLHETHTIPAGASQTLRVTSMPGRVVVTRPAELNIDGGYAEFTPTRNETYLGMGQGAFASILTWPSYQFAVANNAVDYNALRGSAMDLKPATLIRSGTGLGNGNLTGKYGVVAITHNLADNGNRTVALVRGSVTADGSGTLTGGSLEQKAVVRTANDSATVSLATASVAASAVVGGGYGVAGDGSISNLTVNTGGAIPVPTMSGNLSLDGNFFYAAAAQVGASNVSHTAVFALKQFAGTPDLSQVDVGGTPTNRRYRFMLGTVRYGDGSGSNAALLRLERFGYGNIEFDAAAQKAYVRVVANAAERADDLSGQTLSGDLTTLATPMTLDYVANNDGTVDFTAGDGTTLRAFVSADGRKFLLALVGYNYADNPFNGSELGIGVGNCANCP